MSAQPWKDIHHKSSPGKRAQLREAAHWNSPLSLAELRKSKNRTQEQVAEALEVTQPRVSRIEGEGDMLVSTLRAYVEALGGTLEIRALFAGGEIKQVFLAPPLVTAD